MLERDDIDLVSTVFHELLHATIAQSDNDSAEDNTFNESLGTFVGRQATLQYHRDRFPDTPERIQAATERFEDADRFGQFALELFDELDAFYNSDITPQEKTAGREAVFQAARDRFELDVLPLMHDPERYEGVRNLPTNNAYVLLLARYNLELNVFADVFTTTGESWPMALQVFRLAATHDGSPFDYLRQWVQDRQPAASIPQQ
jgi:predicted aminopeptidase